MAFSMNGGGIGSRRQRGGTALSEINVTPFVDVVLVLLIIFMLTAHVMEYGLEVDVPKTRATRESVKDIPTISIPKDGTIFLNDKPVNINDLKSSIQQRFGTATKGVYLMADKATIYDVIAQVTAELGAAGFQVNLVTEPMDAGAKGGRK